MVDLLNFGEIELGEVGSLLEPEALYFRCCFELVLDAWHCELTLEGISSSPPPFLCCSLAVSGGQKTPWIGIQAPPH